MSNLIQATPERIDHFRERLHREDPQALVRPGAESGSIEVASVLPHTRVSAILHDVFGMETTTQGATAGVDDCCADEADGEGCCGCCGH